MKPFPLQSGERHAWQTLTPGRGESDYCTREGALALKQTIETYWRERGHDVMIALENVGFHPAIRAARYDLRSDMVNGMPRGAFAAAPDCNEPMQPDRWVDIDDDLVFE